MILFARKMIFTDCYVENISTQMELLKIIEVNKVFNIYGVCPKWNS